jgi:aconitate decarboxylase
MPPTKEVTMSSQTGPSTPNPPRPVTRELAAFAVAEQYSSLPEDLVDRMRTDALDAIAVGIFGHTRPWVSLATGLWEQHGGVPEATLWGRSSRLPIPRAVMANSNAVNSFEFDDTYVWGGHGTHQGNNVVPAAVAVAEWLGGVPGPSFLLALSVGHEIGIRIARGFVKKRPGWNGTALVSTFGAAAAAGKLLNLSEEQMTWALGTAGSYVGGVLTIPPHSMAKRLVNGRAAEGGVIGALLAQRGFTGIENVLEARQGGFYQTHAEEYDLDRVVAGLGSDYLCRHVHTKRFPMVTSAHAAIEATLQVVRAHEIHSKDVKQVVVRTTSGAQQNMVGFLPETISSAQLSLAFGIATAVKTGNVRASAITEQALVDPELRRLMSAVTPVKDPELDAMWSGRAQSGGPARIEVELAGGAWLKSDLVPEASRMTNDEIEDKARNLMGPVVGERSTEGIIGFFRQLEEHRSLDGLLMHLRRE